MTSHFGTLFVCPANQHPNSVHVVLRAQRIICVLSELPTNQRGQKLRDNRASQNDKIYSPYTHTVPSLCHLSSVLNFAKEEPSESLFPSVLVPRAFGGRGREKAVETRMIP